MQFRTHCMYSKVHPNLNDLKFKKKCLLAVILHPDSNAHINFEDLSLAEKWCTLDSSKHGSLSYFAMYIT